MAESAVPAATDATAELAHLQGRIRRLAEEKSYLQLVLRLIEQIDPLPGMHDMVGSMLRNIVETIGGTNIKIWYWIGKQIQYADFLGGHGAVETIDDPVACQVVESRTFVELANDPADALLMGNVLPASWTWAFPLQVGDELVGVIKLENVNILGASLRSFLPTFFSHAALILSNEVRNHLRQEALKALKEKSAELDGYFNNALDLFCIADTDGRFIKLNAAWTRSLGYDTAALEGKDFIDLVHPDDREATLAAVARLSAQQPVANFTNRYRHQDGSWHWIEWCSQPSGRLIYAAARDITDKKAAEDSLRLAASVFANSQEGILITDAANRIIDVNAAFTRISGYARDEVIGRNPKFLASGRQDGGFYAAMWASLKESGQWRGEIWNRRKSGEVYAEMLSVDAVRDASGNVRHYVGAFSDISQIKEHQEELERIAHFDTLTGLPNRRLLADRLGHELARTRRSGRALAICYLDLDGFKPVNDLYGHEAGDRLLIDISRRLTSVSRAGDTVARIGGDEFVLLLCDLGQEQECFQALERILATIARPFDIDQQQVIVTGSIGVTLFPRDNADADTLMRHADQAMYQAKEAGKSRFHLFDAEHDRLVKANRETLQRLETALARNEFVLYYQPKVDLTQGKVIGVEALIRWQHPQRGLLPPAEFLPLLTGTDLEFQLGEWVIESALVQLESWQSAAVDLIVSVNVSPGHLQRPGFLRSLESALQRHATVPPSSLELEIVESAAIDDLANASRILAGCIALGVQFALDDFGTGYSSLSYFRKLPVGVLKIDQSFVRGMLEDPEDLAIIQSVISLAKAFNRPVIAEGVETIEHGAMLVMLGCHLGQGYGIARPMPASELPGWIAGWRGEEIWMALNRYALPAEDIVLMVAARSHQKWVDELIAHVEQPERTPPPALPHTQCAFGRWYYGSALTRYGSLAEFTGLEHPHAQLHTLAGEICECLAQGDQAEARVRLPAIQTLCEEISDQLDRLVSRVRSGLNDTPPLPDA